MADHDDLDRWIKHEKRFNELSPMVESLWWHHTHDRLLERMRDMEAVIAELSKKRAAAGVDNGNGQRKDTETRLRWVERILWGALGAVAMFELLGRVWKLGG